MHPRGLSKARAFTLIELLIVIGIIGLLAAVILVALNGAKAKSVIASIQEFDAHIFQVHGVSAGAIYGFNETSGNAIDASYARNDLTMNGATRTSSTYSGTGYALSVSGTTDAINASPTGLPTGQNATAEAWIYPTGYTDPTYTGVVSWGSRSCTNAFLMSIRNNGYLSMATWCNDAYQTNGPSVPLNTWTHIAVSMKGTSVTFYINGKPVDTQTLGSTPNLLPGPLAVGCTDWTTGRCFIGNIDDVRIYSDALTMNDVYRDYAEGVLAHGVAIK